MNKKLNTIAFATTLASLGFCSLTYGWQTNNDSLVGTGVSDVSQVRHSADASLPPIVSSAAAVSSENDDLPPIISGKLIQQVSAQSVGIPTKELETFSQGAGLKPLNSILGSKAPNVYRPPAPPKTVKSSARTPAARIAKAAAPLTPRTSQGSGTRSVLGEIAQDYTNGNNGNVSQADVLPDVSQPAFDGTYGTSTYDPAGVNGAYSEGFQQNNYGQSGYVDPNTGPPAYTDPNFANQGIADSTSYFDQNAAAYSAPVTGGCATCGNSLIDGACSTCGPAAGYADGPIIRDYGTFGSVSAANRYLYLDALIMTRADGDIANSNFGTLNDFDFTGGIRATYGVRDDSIFGREMTFMALPGVEQEISRTDPLIQTPFRADQGGRLSVGSIPISGAPAEAFFNATSQTQRKESDLYSLEFNRVNWGWDLIKTFSGIRYVRFDDSYNVRSTGRTAQRDAAGDVITNAGGNTQFDTVQGDYTLDASNTLLGAQIGGELFYDIGYRWSASGFGKFGLFANFNDFDTNYNNGDFNVSSESDSVTLSTVAELGLLAHYQIRTNLRFRGGYNAMFVGNVASVADNIGRSSGLFTGFEANDSDDVLFHGFNFGLEFYR